MPIKLLLWCAKIINIYLNLLTNMSILRMNYSIWSVSGRHYWDSYEIMVLISIGKTTYWTHKQFQLLQAIVLNIWLWLSFLLSRKHFFISIAYQHGVQLLFNNQTNKSQLNNENTEKILHLFYHWIRMPTKRYLLHSHMYYNIYFSIAL